MTKGRLAPPLTFVAGSQKRAFSPPSVGLRSLRENSVWYQSTVPKGRLSIAQHAVLGFFLSSWAVPQGRLKNRRTLSCGTSVVPTGLIVSGSADPALRTGLFSARFVQIRILPSARSDVARAEDNEPSITQFSGETATSPVGTA
jgi:hypothetical protein